MATKPTAKKAESETKDAAQSSTGGITIKGSEMTGKKTETRQFQTAPDTKEWLTKEQATEKGFYWKDAD